MSTFKRWWRPMVVGLLGGGLAFTGSFAVSDTFAAGTRVLIRGREASFLTDRAQNVSDQPGIVDASFAKTLGATQAGIVTSREMAVTIVDQLKLDQQPIREQGLLTRTLRQGMLVYAKTKAYLKHGYYKKPTRREQAIKDVQLGLGAQALENSYILEIAATAETPEGARDIANAVANELVAGSNERAKGDAKRYADILLIELTDAEKESSAAAAAIGAFKTKNGIASVDTELSIDATTSGQLRNEVVQNEIAIAGTQAELQSLENSLKTLKPQQQGEQTIKTGRSETKILSNQPSTLYQQLVQQRDTARSQLAALKARQQALKAQLDNSRQPKLNAEQAALAPLEERLQIARTRRAQLANRYAEAKANATQPGIELTRIDEAAAPDYPVGPKRYLYLALGLLLGALAGWGLTLATPQSRSTKRTSTPQPTKTSHGSGPDDETTGTSDRSVNPNQLELIDLSANGVSKPEVNA
jgi:uncharacterized protein involved in exopolysaccharide biosynthesis